MGEGTSPLRRFRKPDTFVGAGFRTFVMTARLGLPNPNHTRKSPVDFPIHREQLGKKGQCNNPVGVGSPNPSGEGASPLRLGTYRIGYLSVNYGHAKCQHALAI